METMKARITLLHKTEAAWNKISFQPKLGEIIVYDPDENYNYARLKIGDGIHELKDLPFLVEATINDKSFVAIDGGRID
mgnify:CR=1 FL=1